MSVRAATPADLDAIMAIEKAAFPTDAWSRDMMLAELESIFAAYYVAELDGEIVGYAGLRHLDGQTDADVQTIAVTEGARGHGLGRRLLRTLMAEAQRRRAREMFLDVRDDNAVAQALYESEGFVEIGRRTKYYQPDGIDAIVMRAPLSAYPVAGPFDEVRNGQL